MTTTATKCWAMTKYWAMRKTIADCISGFIFQLHFARRNAPARELGQEGLVGQTTSDTASPWGVRINPNDVAISCFDDGKDTALVATFGVKIE